MALKQHIDTIRAIYDSMSAEDRATVVSLFSQLDVLQSLKLDEDQIDRLKSATMGIAVSMAMRGPEKTFAEIKAALGVENKVALGVE